MSNVMSLPSVGQFVGVSRDAIIRPRGADRDIRLILYGAYNAGGLIGSEFNGIAVLDETNKQVLCAHIGKEACGYFGPSKMQEALFEGLLAAGWEHIVDTITGHGGVV